MNYPSIRIEGARAVPSGHQVWRSQSIRGSQGAPAGTASAAPRRRRGVVVGWSSQLVSRRPVCGSGDRMTRVSHVRRNRIEGAILSPDIRINDQWRVCFRFDRGDAFDVEITDYH